MTQRGVKRFRYHRCPQLVMDLQSQDECSVWWSVPRCEFEHLSLELLIKLASPGTKYQCTPLREKELAVPITDKCNVGKGRGRGSSSSGRTVSECRGGSVTYCFTGKLPDLLGGKARSPLVYTQPWISAWNMSTSSQPISHKGGAVWAADTSRFPWTMRPIPHARLSVCDWRCGETDTDRGTLLLHWATEPSPPWGPSWWDQPRTPVLI